MAKRKEPVKPQPESADTTALTVNDLPDQEILTSLGVESNEYHEFWIAIKYTELQAAGATSKDIFDKLGYHHSTFQSPRWRRLISAAQRLLLARATSAIGSATVRFYQRVPEIVDAMAETALHAPRGSDRVKAAEFLNSIFPFTGQNEGDSTPEHNYLKNPPNFSPQMPLQMLQIQPGANVTIVNSAPPVKTPDILEAEVVDDSEPLPPNVSFAPKSL